MANRIHQRHNAECKYQPSNKQHASNKSVGSVTTEEAPEKPSYRDENRNSTADILAESPDGAQLPQNSTITPIGGVNCVSEGSSNNFQGMTSVTDDRNNMPFFLDKHADDNSWASYMDWTGNKNSRAQSSVDINNVHGSGTLFWPPSTKSTDSEFDLDIPFTVEHTDSLTALSSLLELDLPLSSTGQAKDQDDTRTWGELISNMNFDEKASARTSFGFDETVIRNANKSSKISKGSFPGKISML